MNSIIRVDNMFESTDITLGCLLELSKERLQFPTTPFLRFGAYLPQLLHCLLALKY